MADTATSAPVTNGAAVAGDDSPAAPKMTRAEMDAAAKAAFMADSGDDEVEATKPAAKPVVKKAKAKEESLEDEIVSDEDDEDDAEIAEIEDEEDELGKVAADKESPELTKHREQLRKQEKRMRAKIEQQSTQREAAFVKERDAFVAEWKPKIEAAQAFDKIPKHDIVGILKAKGYSEDDYADASKILWGLSKEGGAEPKNREAVARLQRERALSEKADAAMARVEALEAERDKQKTQDQQTKSVEIYLRRVTKAVDDETPLVKKRLEAAPKATRTALEKVAFVLAQKSGELVDPRKVAKVYEKRLRATVDRAVALGDFVKAPPTAAGKSPAVQVRAKAPAIKVVDQTAGGPIVEHRRSNGVTLPDRNDMIERLRKIDRGELDPDAD